MTEKSHPDDEPHPIQAAARRVLDSFGYKGIVNKKGTSILFEAQTPGGRWWRSRFAIFEDSRIMTVESFVTDDLYAPARRDWVIELCGRATEAIPTGCFAFKFPQGWVTYRSFGSFAEQPVSERAIEALLNSISFPLRVWEAAFEYRHTPTSPETALEASLFRLDGLEGGVAEPTRRALLKVNRSEGKLRREHVAIPTLTLL